MALVLAQVIGGDHKSLSANTVGEVKAQLGVPTYTALVNDDAVGDDFELEDRDFVSLAPPVKAG